MRRSKLALDLVALLGLLLLLANPAAAAPPPARQAFSPPVLAANPHAPKPTPNAPGVRPKATSAAATTTSAGPVEPSSGEIVSLRTRTSRTYATADGDEAFLYTESVNYQATAGAAWRKIDNSLVASGTTYHNAANRYIVTVPATLGQSPVKLQVGASWLTLALSGASSAAAASVSGNAATFANALPNANLVVAAGGDAIEAALVLTAATAPSSYTFSVATSSDLSVKQSGNTITVVTTATGQPLLTIPPAGMADSSGNTAGASTSVTQSLATAPGSASLTISADPAWLASPSRVYPVTIDPSVTLSSSPACRIETDFPNQGFCGSFLRAGNNGSYTWRDALQFDLSSIPNNSVVLDAELDLYAYAFSSNLAMLVNLQQVTTPWDNTVTWDNATTSTAWHAAGGDFLAAPAWSQTVAATVDWNSWGLTDLAQGWVDGSMTNDGVLLKAAVESQANTQDYHGNESLFQDKKPALKVVYEPGMGELGYYPLQGFGLTDRMDLGVNLANGNLVLHAHDLGIAGTAGLGLALDRWYNSLAAVDAGRDFGPAWVMNDGYDVRMHDGQDGEYVFGPGDWALHFQHTTGGGYTAPPGIDATLVKQQNTVTLTFNQSQITYTFAPPNQTGDRAVSSISDQDGNTITFNTNNNGLETTVVDTQQRTVTFSYGSATYPNFVTQIVDSTGRTWQYAPDSSGRLHQYTDPAGHTTTYWYDDPNNTTDLTRIVDPDGNTTALTYANHKVTAITFASQSNPDVHGTYTFTYNTGNTVVTDPNTHQTTYTITKQNDTQLATQVTDALGDVVKYAWNADNHVGQYTDAKQQVFAYAYDVAGVNACSTTAGTNNLCSVTYPTGATLSWQYKDSAHPYYPTSATDAQGNTVSFTYTTAGNLATVTNQLSSQNQTQYFYNANGTLDHVIDGRNNTTSYGYTGGNLTSITPPSPMQPTSIGVDGLSRVQSVTDGNSHQRTYTYDALDRVTALTYPSYSAGNVTYVPDPDGNVTSMTDSTGTTSYQYDARNRQTKKTLPGGGYFTYGYDPKSNLTSLTDASSVAGQSLAVAYGYDAADRLQTLVDPSGTTSFTADANGYRHTTTYPDGTVMTETRDNSQRLSSIVAVNGATTLSSFSYSFVNGGKDTLLPYGYAETLASPTGGQPAQVNASMTYDQLNRLTKWLVTNQSDGSVVHDYSYQFDGNSNRTQVIADPQNGAGQVVSDPSLGLPHSNESDLSFTAANEISQIVAYGAAGTNPTTTLYSYDSAGNQLGNDGGGTGKPLTISYLPTNQTQAISDINQNNETMTWTGAGQAERTKRTWSDQGTSYTATYTWSLLGLSGYSNNGINEPTGTTSVTSWIVRDPSGRPIAQRYSAGSEYYYLFDGQGDVVGLEDPGTMLAAYDYCPTGNNPALPGVQPTQVGLANPLRMGAVPYDDLTKDYVRSSGCISEDYSGTCTQGPASLSFECEVFGPEDGPQFEPCIDTEVGPGIGGGSGGGAAPPEGGPGGGGAELEPGFSIVGQGSGPRFIGSPAGDVITIPTGATGPTPVETGRGFQFSGGTGGGYGLNARVTGVRVMDPTGLYPNGYVVYMNAMGQTVDPFTGRTIPRDDPLAHIPLSAP